MKRVSASGALALVHRSTHVLLMGDWLQVGWVDADHDTAKMVKSEPVGDGADEELIEEPVIHHPLAAESN